MINVIICFLIAIPASDYAHDARWPGVCMRDAYEFGATRADARQSYHLARRHIEHYDELIRSQYAFPIYMNWKEQANFHLRAWDLLDDVLLWSNTPYEWKMERLWQLKKHLGDEAYNGRRMPGPTPGHLFN